MENTRDLGQLSAEWIDIEAVHLDAKGGSELRVKLSPVALGGWSEGRSHLICPSGAASGSRTDAFLS